MTRTGATTTCIVLTGGDGPRKRLLLNEAAARQWHVVDAADPHVAFAGLCLHQQQVRAERVRADVHRSPQDDEVNEDAGDVREVAGDAVTLLLADPDHWIEHWPALDDLLRAIDRYVPEAGVVVAPGESTRLLRTIRPPLSSSQSRGQETAADDGNRLHGDAPDQPKSTAADDALTSDELQMLLEREDESS